MEGMFEGNALAPAGHTVCEVFRQTKVQCGGLQDHGQAYWKCGCIVHTPGPQPRKLMQLKLRTEMSAATLEPCDILLVESSEEVQFCSSEPIMQSSR